MKRLSCRAITKRVLIPFNSTLVYGAHRSRLLPSIGIVLVLACGLASAAELPIVADDSYAGIPKRDLDLILSHLAGNLSAKTPTLVAQLRPVRDGYCGYVNTSLEHDAFVPFYFDTSNLTLKFAAKRKLSENPDESGCPWD
jgi:hypothetical protein